MKVKNKPRLLKAIADSVDSPWEFVEAIASLEGMTMAEVAEKKEGCYFDITIPEGRHWSVSDGSYLKALIDDFKKRLYQTNIIK